MSSYKLLSEYFSDDNKRRATVLKDLNSGEYRVTVVSEAGSAFTSIFSDEDSADIFAEEWVQP